MTKQTKEVLSNTKFFALQKIAKELGVEYTKYPKKEQLVSDILSAQDGVMPTHDGIKKTVTPEQPVAGTPVTVKPESAPKDKFANCVTIGSMAVGTFFKSRTGNNVWKVLENDPSTQVAKIVRVDLNLEKIITAVNPKQNRLHRDYNWAEAIVITAEKAEKMLAPKATVSTEPVTAETVTAAAEPVIVPDAETILIAE